MKIRSLPVTIGGLSLLYPLIVYAGFRAGYYQTAALLVVFCFALRAHAATRRYSSGRALISFMIACVVAALMGLIVLTTPHAPLFFPAVINVALCAVFGLSLLSSRNIIERIALYMEGSVPPEGRRYCTKVCVAWVVFFATNAAVAFDSAFRSLEWWTLYNGLISYCCIGLLVGGEFLIRRGVKKRLHKQVQAVCLTAFLVSALLLCSCEDVLAETRAPQAAAMHLERIRHRLTPPGPFSVDFTERRFIAVLTEPLESRGIMRCIPGQGLLWETKTPVHRNSIITRRSITEVVGQQTVTTVVDSTGVSQTMLSLLSGRIEDVDDLFELSVIGDESTWEVRLTPKDTLVRQVISTVSVSGKERPQQLEVVHASGDRVLTMFSEPHLLTISEREQTQEALKRAS